MSLSNEERNFILKGISLDSREDGRRNNECRRVSINVDVMPHVNGSARASLSGGETDVLVAVRADVARPSIARPDEGLIQFSVDTSASAAAVSSASLAFDDAAAASFVAENFASSSSSTLSGLSIGRRPEPGGGFAVFGASADVAADETGAAGLAGASGGGGSAVATSASVALGSMLAHAFGSSALDMKALCLAPGKLCWSLSVDVLVLSALAGNVQGVASAAVRAALGSTLVPEAEYLSSVGGTTSDAAVSSSANANAGNQQQGAGHSSSALPLELAQGGSISVARKLSICRAPVIISLWQVGRDFLLDASPHEESCASARIDVAVAEDQRICSLNTCGAPSLHPIALQTCIELAALAAKDVIESMNKMLAERALLDHSAKANAFTDARSYQAS